MEHNEEEMGMTEFVESFEEQVIKSLHLSQKPTRWFRYVNDTFVIWPHCPESLYNFLITWIISILKYALNWRSWSATFQTAAQITRYTVNQLIHTLYPTIILQTSLLTSLFHRAVSLSEPSNLEDELQFLTLNGCSPYDLQKCIQHTLHPKPNRTIPEPNPISTTVLPYVHKVTDRITV